MGESVTMARCRSCQHIVFPPREICSRCGGSSWDPCPARSGHVDEITVLRYRTGGGSDQPEVLLASVTSDLGPVVLARLSQPVRPGDTVDLVMDRGAVTAHPRRAYKQGD